jgi:3-methyladenine DNA glycosylase AlkD
MGKLAKGYGSASLDEILKLLECSEHEARLLALFILVAKYAKGDSAERDGIYRAYLDHTAFINNWDLVDTSAEHIVGAHLLGRSRRPLYRLARSKDLWERRIGIMATFHFVKRRDSVDALQLSELLLNDSHDLIHKAVGWMLREIGNRDHDVEVAFLDAHYRHMPRTMLRYAIEKFPEPERLAYLHGSRGAR